MSRPFAQVENVTKVYSAGRGEVLALREVSLAVEEGEFVCVVGPPGAGKSTLLHILGLLDSPSAGRVWVSGEDVSLLSGPERADFRLERVGFVFQFFNLLRELTALENVMLPMLVSGHDARESRDTAKRLLDEVGLADRLEHRPGQLSGGQQQRVAVARALANDPALILADEPTGNLDSKTSFSIRELLADLARRGRTVLVVSHERDWTDVAQRVVHLRDGRVVAPCTAPL